MGLSSTSLNRQILRGRPRYLIVPGRPLLASLLVSVSVLVPTPSEAQAVQSGIVETRVATSSDDAEERLSGRTSLTSSDLELVRDNNHGDQVVGIRFAGVDLPPRSHIDSAYLQFQVDETGSDPATLTLRGEATDNASAFAGTDFEISSRTPTAVSVIWSPPAWNTVGEAGPDQQPDHDAVTDPLVER